MRLNIQSFIWDELKLNDKRRYEVARACFYLHMGLESVKDALYRPESEEAQDIVNTAVLMGLQDDDILVRV